MEFLAISSWVILRRIKQNSWIKLSSESFIRNVVFYKSAIVWFAMKVEKIVEQSPY